MRPVSLTVTGLHSYREPVTVDFDDLGRYGLFGIFGKIGSGKSTLLDAMTLALYGQVDRVATRSRKGLVNLASDRCEVRLRFAVQGETGEERYEVHRSYRDHDGVAQRTASRLVHLRSDGVSEVIADKERDVNGAVTEVVGLEAEDFMRAVVLPQGRFMQLLHLKGTERRKMLQRIFRLHAYGETLRKEVRERQQARRAELAQVRGELVGIGDASPQAVTRARRAAAGARAARSSAEGTHTVAALRHEEAARLRERHERLTRARSELTEHRAQRPAIETLEAEVEAAEHVRPVVEPAEAWRLAREAEAGSARSATAAAREEEAARAQLAALQTDLTKARAAAAEREPGLRERIAGLEQALERLAEHHRIEAQHCELDEAHAAGATELASIREQHESALLRVTELEGERRKHKRDVRKSQVAAEDRQRAQRAARAADALDRARSLVSEARTEVTAFDQRVTQAAAELDRATAFETEARTALRAAEAQLAKLAGDEAIDTLSASLASSRQHATQRTERRSESARLQEAHGEALSRVDAAESVLSIADAEARTGRQIRKGAERAVRDAEARADTERQRHTAAALSAALDAGAPCPVCGSDHHPAPAEPASEGLDDLLAAVQAHREGRRRAIERHDAATGAQAKAAALADAARTERDRIAEQLDRVQQQLAVLGAGPEPEEIDATLQRHGELVALQQAARVEAERASAPVAAASALLTEAEAARDQAGGVVEQRETEEGGAWEAFDADRGELTLFDVANALQALDARDLRTEALYRQLEAVDTALAEARERSTSLAGRGAELERDQAELGARRTAAAERLAQLTEEVAKHAGNDIDPADALSSAMRDLDGVVAEVERAATAREAAGEAHHALARERASAEASARAAAETLTGARSRLLEALAGLGHSDVDDPDVVLTDLLPAARPEAQLALARSSISRWREAEAGLAARVEMLEEGSGGAEPPNEEAWKTLCQEQKRAAEALELAREQAAAASTAAAETEARAPRWVELTERALVVDAELTRLDTLSGVLRGDRFVEYVANDHLTELAARASTHLSTLTHDRYVLELDDDAAFQVRDAEAGGAVRPVHTLSGGEAFLTALSLALALSTQVQARSTRPLGFFFLDEGFGTLDHDALDRVMTAIEALRDPTRVIGLISHVPEVRERVPRYLWVTPAGQHTAGSTVEVRDN